MRSSIKSTDHPVEVSACRSTVTFIVAGRPDEWRVLGFSHSRPLCLADVETLATLLAAHLGVAEVAVIDVEPAGATPEVAR